MANVTTNPRFWSLTDVAVIAADGTDVIVRRLVYSPAAAGNSVTIQEYLNGALVDCMVLPAGAGDASPVTLPWDGVGRALNGFKLSAISGGTLYVYLGND